MRLKEVSKSTNIYCHKICLLGKIICEFKTTQLLSQDMLRNTQACDVWFRLMLCRHFLNSNIRISARHKKDLNQQMCVVAISFFWMLQFFNLKLRCQNCSIKHLVCNFILDAACKHYFSCFTIHTFTLACVIQKKSI